MCLEIKLLEDIHFKRHLLIFISQTKKLTAGTTRRTVV